jgi:hypothetical protein
MARKDFDEHYCLAIYPQGRWKKAYEEKLVSSVKASFLKAGGHSDCETCCTCPVCRSFEEMFDPTAPGGYDQVCGLCRPLDDLFRTKLGKTEGIILLSHFRPVAPETMAALFKDKNVKKVYILNLRKKKTEELTAAKLAAMPSKVISEKDYPQCWEEPNTILEVRRKEYTGP